MSGIGNASKEEKNVNPFRLQMFDVLNEMMTELPYVEDYVFNKFRQELFSSRVFTHRFESFFGECAGGKHSWHCFSWGNYVCCNLFTPPVRNIFDKCVDEIYIHHKANSLSLIRISLSFLVMNA